MCTLDFFFLVRGLAQFPVPEVIIYIYIDKAKCKKIWERVDKAFYI